MKIKVHYDPENRLALPDKRIDGFIEKLVAEDFSGDLIIGSEMMILAFRYFVKRGLISYKNISFNFINIDVRVDKDGKFINFPEGINIAFEDYCIELL